MQKSLFVSKAEDEYLETITDKDHGGQRASLDNIISRIFTRQIQVYSASNVFPMNVFCEIWSSR